MRILHILDHSLPIQSGYSYRTVAILREQRKLGWETFPLTTPRQGETQFPSEEVGGIEFFRTNNGSVKNKKGILWYIDEMRMTYKKILEVAREVQPSMIHAHSPALTAVPAFYAGRRLRLPLVYEIRAFWEDAAVDHGTTEEGGLRYRATRALENYVLKRANHVTTICAGLKEDICLRGIPPEKVTIIPNAVNSENFTKCLYDGPDTKEELGLRPGGLILGFIGSFYAYEGLDLLLDSITTLKTTLPQTQLLLVGGGPQEDFIKEKYSQLIKKGDVIFTGRVPQDQVNKYYDAVDILVYPRHSMRLTELVTPLKPLEAMAKGKILLASDVGGHKELIKDKYTGFLFKADDKEDLIEKIKTIAAMRASWNEISDRARSFVEKERNWGNSVALYRDVYNRALSALEK